MATLGTLCTMLASEFDHSTGGVKAEGRSVTATIRQALQRRLGTRHRERTIVGFDRRHGTGTLKVGALEFSEIGAVEAVRDANAAMANRPDSCRALRFKSENR